MSDDYNVDPYELEEGRPEGLPDTHIPVRALQEAVSLSKKQLFSQWLSTTPLESEKREQLYKEFHLIDRLMSNIQNTINK